MPTPHTQAELPRYIPRAGDEVLPPPYLMKPTGLDILLVKADEGALNALIDRELNEAWRVFAPRGILHRFEAASPIVGFCFTASELTSAKHADDSDPIHARQLELAVMVQLLDNGGDPAHWAHESWYLPFVLSDLPTAVSTGREVFGYPKQWAEFSFQRGRFRRERGWRDQRTQKRFGNGQWAWNPTVVSAYDVAPDTKGPRSLEIRPVLTVRKGALSDGTSNGTRGAGAKSAGEATEERPSLAPPELVLEPSGTRFEWPEAPQARGAPGVRAAGDEVNPREVAQEFKDRLVRDLSYLFLRQFRDPATESDRASYQGVISARLIPEANDVQPVDDPLHLELPPSSFVPLARTLFNASPTEGRRVRVISRLTSKNVDITVNVGRVWWEFP